MGMKQSNSRDFPIDQLNRGLSVFCKALKADPVALSRVQIAVVSVGRDVAELMMDWTEAVEFQAFRLRADGTTPLGEGLNLALDAVESQKALLREFGVPYTRPWIFVITDGEPSDYSTTWRQAADNAMVAQRENKVEIFAVGVEGANLERLSEISSRSPVQLDGLKFEELFTWLSASLSQTTRSAPGAAIDLPPTDGWASVKL